MFGGAGNSTVSGVESWSARLLTQPFGGWLLAASAVGVIAYGVAEWVKAYSTDFEDELDRDLDRRARSTLRTIGRAGLVSRGVVRSIIGGFLGYAALTRDSSQARGLGGALETLGQQAYGPWLMGIVALGLAAYGVFQSVKAKYRTIGSSG